jgi:hypothetical protein
MAVKLDEKDDGKVLEVRVSGKLTHDDYQHFVPEFNRLTQKHGKLRVLFGSSSGSTVGPVAAVAR